jgi:hypothetical protein
LPWKPSRPKLLVAKTTRWCFPHNSCSVPRRPSPLALVRAPSLKVRATKSIHADDDDDDDDDDDFHDDFRVIGFVFYSTTRTRRRKKKKKIERKRRVVARRRSSRRRSYYFRARGWLKKTR